MAKAPDDFEASLENEGEKNVKAKLGKGLYGAWKRPRVQDWLQSKEKAEVQVQQHSELAIARSAKNAAWVAALAAVIGLVISVIALVRTF